MPAITRRAFLSAGGGLAGTVLLGVPAAAARPATVTGGRSGATDAEAGTAGVRAGASHPETDSAPPQPDADGQPSGMDAELTALDAEGAEDAEAGGVRLPRPPVHTRAEWGAAPPKSKAVVLDRAPDRLVIHHTATGNTGDTSLDAAFRLSRAIQRYHMDRNHWEDIGEQFTVSRGGHIMEGRNRTLPAVAEGKHVVGAQAADHNQHTLGIEAEGSYMTELPPSAQLAALTALLAWLCSVYALDPAVAIIGHRDLNATSCPGDRLYQYLPRLRVEVAHRLGGRRASAARFAAPEAGTSGSRFGYRGTPVVPSRRPH